jgi:hypothetical protein
VAQLCRNSPAGRGDRQGAPSAEMHQSPSDCEGIVWPTDTDMLSGSRAVCHHRHQHHSPFRQTRCRADGLCRSWTRWTSTSIGSITRAWSGQARHQTSIHFVRDHDNMSAGSRVSNLRAYGNFLKYKRLCCIARDGINFAKAPVRVVLQQATDRALPVTQKL